VLIAVVLLCTTSFTVTGQDEPPLPPVRVRAAVTPPPPLAEEPSFVLPVEPVRSIDYSAPAESLAEAALRNDYAAFHQLYVERPSPTFAPLHEVWSYAMNNPMGAFYGEELHDRLARAYPSYAAYIEDYRLVDDRGQVFYPTAETRRFLTERAVAGATPSARVQVADVGGTTQLNPLVTRRSTPRVETRTETRETTATPRSTTTPATGPSRKRLKKAEVTIPPVKKQEPVQVAAVAVPPAPVAAKTAAPVQTEQPVPAPPKPVQANVLTPSLPVPVETPGATDPMTGRGALLIVIALAGIGVLMLMLRVPREEVPASIIKPEEKPAEPVTPVAPMRKSKRKASA
jgi:hypothetical protein